MVTDLKYMEIKEKSRGVSFEVEKVFGNGFQEVIDQRALAWDMKQAGLE